MKPISDKIKFQHTESNFDSTTTLRLQIDDLKKEIERLKVIRDDTIDQSAEDFLPLDLFFNEAAHKVHISPHLRTYSQAYRDICTASYILGSKSYCFLRQFFPLISDRDLRRNYSQKISEILEMLCNEERVNEIVAKTSIEGTEDDPIVATIAVDAAKFKNTKGSSILKKLPMLSMHEINPKSTENIYKDIFVFYLQPINVDIKPYPIHIEFHTSGAAPDFIDSIVNILIESLKNLNIHIEYLASDGDHHYDSRHLAFFNLYSSLLNEGIGFSDMIEAIKSKTQSENSVIPISDYLHIIKLIRGILVKGPLVIDTNSKVSISKSDYLNYDLGHAILDRSKVGRMKDCYLLALFSNDSIAKAISQSQGDVLFFTAPFNCIIETLHNPHLSTEIRIFLLEFAFYFILHYLFSFKQNPRCIMTRIGLIRILNTIIGLTIALTRFDLIKLGHISSHPLENFFGMVRLASNNNHSVENAMGSIAKGILLKEIMRKYHLSEQIRTRVGLGGDIASNIKNDGIFPTSTAFQLFKEVWYSMKTASIPETFSIWHQTFRKIEWEDKFYTPSTVSGSNIVARYIADITDPDQKIEKKDEEEKKEKKVFEPGKLTFGLNEVETDSLGIESIGFFVKIYGPLA